MNIEVYDPKILIKIRFENRYYSLRLCAKAPGQEKCN